MDLLDIYFTSCMPCVCVCACVCIIRLVYRTISLNNNFDVGVQ